MKTPLRRFPSYFDLFGLTVEDRILHNQTIKEFKERLFKKQGGKCPICERDLDLKKAELDHDWDTGKIRELLCHGCNSSLSRRKDRILLLKSRNYVYKHKRKEGI